MITTYTVRNLTPQQLLVVLRELVGGRCRVDRLNESIYDLTVETEAQRDRLVEFCQSQGLNCERVR